MLEKLTQEELTAVRQLLRVLSALQKIEPIIQKVLVSDEELARVQREKNAVVKEIEMARADGLKRVVEEVEALRSRGEAETAQLSDQVENKRKELKELDNKCKELEDAERGVKALQKEKSDLEFLVAKLSETAERHKADIAALLNSIQAGLEDPD